MAPARGEATTYLVLSEWESHEVMRAFLMQKRHVEPIRAYKRDNDKGFECRCYARLHGMREEIIE